MIRLKIIYNWLIAALLWLALAIPANATQRLPDTPHITPVANLGLSYGRQGGTLRTLITRARDIRQMTVFGYARLVGYDRDLTLEPDILLALDISTDARTYTFHLRPGHRWSDGHPFTTEDFRYWWEDVALNRNLKPGGPPADLLVNGNPPSVEIIDTHTLRYRWDCPNPGFPALLAGANAPFLYRPAHYMKRFHAAYTDPDTLTPLIDQEKVSGWAALHNRYDNLERLDNPDLPTLQPWRATTRPPAARFIFARNPYFHRTDDQGIQLPYLDEIVMSVAESRLVAPKTQAGEADLQARGLGFQDIPVLKRGERRGTYETHLWRTGRGSHFALYPNLNANDPVWRTALRDRRFRIALSLGIDRTMINEALYFGLGMPGNNTVLPESPVFQERFKVENAGYDPDTANRLLDEMGLMRKGGLRRLPDGRPLRIIVETAGERDEEADILDLIQETWRDIGVALFIRPRDRTSLRNRVYAGHTIMAGWWGLDTALATAAMSPAELAPTAQAHFTWPKWGRHYQSGGGAGEAPDLAAARTLLDLTRAWDRSTHDAERRSIWTSMLTIHAAEQFTIGTVQGVAQPIAVARGLRNVPESGLYAYNPGAYFGRYRPDLFWMEDAP